MSASIQLAPLPTLLRTLRIGMDDSVHIRRTVQLAAAKIEDLEEQVARLMEERRRPSTIHSLPRRLARQAQTNA